MRRRSANTEVLGDQPMLPLDEPPADEPPADEPPADEPPADEPPADEPPALTRRAEVMLQRLRRARELPKGYPGREDAIARHLEALREEGVELAPRSGEAE